MFSTQYYILILKYSSLGLHYKVLFRQVRLARTVGECCANSPWHNLCQNTHSIHYLIIAMPQKLVKTIVHILGTVFGMATGTSSESIGCHSHIWTAL